MNENAVVVAAGCYVQTDPEKVKADTGADIIIGNDQKSRIAELIEGGPDAARQLLSKLGNR